jgi:DNA-binding CsgD family transcriptional regulator
MSSDHRDSSEHHKYSEKIHTLWDELGDFGSREIDAALKHCMLGLCDLIAADNAMWLGLVQLNDSYKPANGTRPTAKFDWGEPSSMERDPMNGWRIGAMEPLYSRSTEDERKRYQAWRKIDDKPGDTSRTIAARAGHFRTYTLHDGFIDITKFRKTRHYDFFYRELDIVDRMWVVFPISANSESCFVFDRQNNAQCFTQDEIKLAKQCLRGIKWFHRQILLSHGLGICEAKLTPTERRVLGYLLTGESEKDIAAKLNVKPSSIHQYCVSTYRKYGVRGRVELMSLWLS